MLQVVFDTNVYVSFLLGGLGAKRLMYFWRIKRFVLLTSALQIEELIGVVQQSFQTRDARQYIALEDLEDLLLILRQRAVFVANRRMGKRSPDADDDWIIGIAIKSKADWLVSQNTQDLFQDLVTPSEKLLVLRISEALNLLEIT
jgi:uncharacterized protein